MTNISALHIAYLDAMGMDRDSLKLNITLERWWYEADQMGITPDDIKLFIKERIKFNQRSDMKRNLALNRIIRTDEDLAAIQCEVAEIRARMRVKVMPTAKAEVLRASGRSDLIPTEPVRHISEVMEAMRKAI